MVLKVGKRGVNSGNTLKASTARPLRLYRKQPCLVRRHIRRTIDARGSDFDNVLGDIDVSADGVPFSLNKKRRWALPGLLKSRILGGDFHGHDFGVQLVERHTIRGPTNAISVCSSKDPNAKAGKNKPTHVIKQKGYLNAKCVLNTKPSSPRRRRYRRREDEPETPETPETNQVIYDVIYPVKQSSSITHNPKNIRYDTKDPSSYLREMSKVRNMRRHRHHRKCAETIDESLCLLADERYDDSEEEDIVFPEAEPVARETNVFLWDILHHATRMQGLFSKANRTIRHSSSSKNSDLACMSDKKHIVYFTKDDDSGSVKQPTRQTVQTPTAEPVRIILKQEDVDPYNLNSIYGHDYTECECFPRKFILDISTDVSKLEGLKYIDGHKADKTPACLVFTHDADNEINNKKENVYKVSLNMKVHQSLDRVKIASLFDYTQCSIDEIIQKTLFYIETLPAGVVTKERRPYDVTPCKMDGAVENCANWKCVAHLPTDIYLYETYLASANNDNESTQGFEFVSCMDAYCEKDIADITSPKEQVCYICYSELSVEEAATALMACGHWFCDVCWREHLITSISAGAVTLLCPEYDCNRTVDRATLLTLVNMEQVLRHLKCCHDTDVEQQDVTKWCPSPHCGRVVQVNSLDVNIAQCTCENKFCFKCLRSVHWPAPCDVVPKYVKKLYASGDISILPPEFTNAVTVDGKNCPHCKRFVEKNGGCPCMTCVCGKNFCWGCGKPWGMMHDASMHDECYRLGTRDKHGTVERTINGDVRRTSNIRRKWYKLAVRHHVQQHPLKLKELKSGLRELSKTITAYVGKAALRGEPIALDFQLSTNKTYKCDAEKVQEFLKVMVEQYREMNHIAEHIGVLLDSGKLTTNNRGPFSVIASRLAVFAELIYNIFTSHVAHNPKQILEILQDIHAHSRQCIDGLVRCVRKVGM